MIKWILILLLFSFVLPGCQLTAYDGANGMRYIKGSAGLNVGQPEGQIPTIPALVVWDVPVMNFKVSSPVLTEIARLAMAGTGGILDSVVDGVSKLLGYLGLTSVP